MQTAKYLSSSLIHFKGCTEEGSRDLKSRKPPDSLKPASPASLITSELASKFNKGVLSPCLISGITIAETAADERESTKHE